MSDKITVETTGDFMLLDITTGTEIAAEGTTEVPMSLFIKDRLEKGDLNEIKGSKKPEPKKAD